jgi:hypothetical protein
MSGGRPLLGRGARTVQVAQPLERGGAQDVFVGAGSRRAISAQRKFRYGRHADGITSACGIRSLKQDDQACEGWRKASAGQMELDVAE